MDTHIETIKPETEALVECGFSEEEIVALLWLRQWYQTGGSDQAVLLRYWEFLKVLIMNGKLDL